MRRHPLAAGLILGGILCAAVYLLILVFAPGDAGHIPVRSLFLRLFTFYGVPVVIYLSCLPALFQITKPSREPGHCPCGHNLTGNTSGVCPECGRETAR